MFIDLGRSDIGISEMHTFIGWYVHRILGSHVGGSAIVDRLIIGYKNERSDALE
jgi:hypothetical protein